MRAGGWVSGRAGGRAGGKVSVRAGERVEVRAGGRAGGKVGGRAGGRLDGRAGGRAGSWAWVGGSFQLVRTVAEVQRWRRAQGPRRVVGPSISLIASPTCNAICALRSSTGTILTATGCLVLASPGW